MPASQLSALRDLELTYDEYERAFHLAVQCMSDQGLEVRGPNSENNGRYLTYSFSSTDSEADSQCFEEHLSYVHRVWVESQIPTGAEADRVREEYADCVHSVGLDPPTDGDLAILERFVGESLRDPTWGNNAALDACIRQYSNAIFSNDPWHLSSGKPWSATRKPRSASESRQPGKDVCPISANFLTDLAQLHTLTVRHELTTQGGRFRCFDDSQSCSPP